MNNEQQRVLQEPLTPELHGKVAGEIYGEVSE
jgi:hypothetical protein